MRYNQQKEDIMELFLLFVLGFGLGVLALALFVLWWIDKNLKL